MLVNLKQILTAASRDGYAVGNFDVCSSTMLEGVMQAAEANRSPVILAYGGDFQKYAPIRTFSAMLRAAAAGTELPVCIHWDHATSLDEIRLALDCGFSSVMIDASGESFEKNVAVTRQAVEMCRDRDVSVESELGHVGAESKVYDTANYRYTEPDKAGEFVARTGIDALAVAIGNVHGVYAAEPRINVELVRTIRRLVDVPVVLHGASGIGDGDIRRCVAAGIGKINIFTELCQNAARSVAEGVAAGENFSLLTGRAVAAVRERAEEKMRLFGSAGRS